MITHSEIEAFAAQVANPEIDGLALICHLPDADFTAVLNRAEDISNERADRLKAAFSLRLVRG
jgi:hypothetical protein